MTRSYNEWSDSKLSTVGENLSRCLVNESSQDSWFTRTSTGSSLFRKVNKGEHNINTKRIYRSHEIYLGEESGLLDASQFMDRYSVLIFFEALDFILYTLNRERVFWGKLAMFCTIFLSYLDGKIYTGWFLDALASLKTMFKCKRLMFSTYCHLNHV